MNIAIAINEAYIPYAYVMLTSLFENHPDRKITVYIMYGEIPDESLMIFGELEEKYGQSICAIQVPLDALPDFLPSTQMWTREVYFRLMLQDLLPESVERILYLDTDIVITGRLDDYYDIDLGNAFLAVNPDMSVLRCGLVQKQEQLFEKHIMAGDFCYFNAGVMLINLKLMRQHYNFAGFMEEFLVRKDLIYVQEQDLLNDLFSGRILYVPEERYDLFAKVAYNEGKGYAWVKEHTSIVHYAGSKPWTGDAARYDTELIWWEYARLTPFYQELMEATFFMEMKSGYADDTIRRLGKEKSELVQLLAKVKKYLPQ